MPLLLRLLSRMVLSSPRTKVKVRPLEFTLLVMATGLVFRRMGFARRIRLLENRVGTDRSLAGWVVEEGDYILSRRLQV